MRFSAVPATGQCRRCGGETRRIATSGPAPAYCSKECKRLAANQRHAEYYRAAAKLKPTRLCKECGKDVTNRKAARGKWVRYCSDECHYTWSERARKARLESLGICSVYKCRRKVTRVGAKMCEACHAQFVRTGSTDRLRKTGFCITDAGYVLVFQKDHPLKHGKGSLPVHRRVVYDDVGDGPHPCHWCGELVDWDEIHVDHLNEIKMDNRRENLVVACGLCNRARGAMIGFIRRMQPESVPQFIATLEMMRDPSREAREAAFRAALEW